MLQTKPKARAAENILCKIEYIMLQAVHGKGPLPC